MISKIDNFNDININEIVDINGGSFNNFVKVAVGALTAAGASPAVVTAVGVGTVAYGGYLIYKGLSE